MNNSFIKQIKSLHKQFDDFLLHISESDLPKKLIREDSNTISQHLRCIGGGRESITKCLVENKSFNWTVELKDESLNDLQAIRTYLNRYIKTMLAFLEENTLSEEQMDLVFYEINHEYMHQGQLFRYLVHHEMGYPKSWDEKWYFSHD